MIYSEKEFTGVIDNILKPEKSFDIIKREITIGGRSSALYFVDGFMKDAVFEKLMEFLYKITPEQLAGITTMRDFSRGHMPYTEADWSDDPENICTQILSGQAAIVIDGIGDAIIIDSRTYPLRSIDEPQKDRSIRGSKDGFVEALIVNTSLIRRRIRDPRLRMEYHRVGSSSKVDIAVGYIEGLADERVLKNLRKRIESVRIKGVSMTQEALSEALVPTSFFNPLPKMKFSERPDFASASILEGRIVVVMDNSPGVMILPTSFADFLKEVDDYYFPPITSSYVRIVRVVSTLLTVYLLPVIMLINLNPSGTPEMLRFLITEQDMRVSMFAQFLLLEFLVDALRLASLNTPDALSNSVGIIGGLILSEFAVSAGWFVPQTIIFSSFVAIASYSQPSFEVAYAAKFLRVIMLFLVRFTGAVGILLGTLLGAVVMLFSKTVNGKGYLYPLIPFNFRDLCKLVVRPKIDPDKH